MEHAFDADEHVWRYFDDFLVWCTYDRRSSLTTGELMSLFTYTANILMSLIMFSMVFVMVVMSIASGERIAQVINQKSDLVSPENGIKEIKTDKSILKMFTLNILTFKMKQIMS